MALPSTIYRVALHLSDVDRGIYESVQTTVAQHPSETEERLVARLLALAIFYQPGLTFTKGLSATDEPDFWGKGADDRVQLWGEVGLPDSDRIIKASRHSDRVALLACGRSLHNWTQQHLHKLEKLANLTIVSLDQAFISILAAQLQRSITWSITITEDILYLVSDEQTYQTTILSHIR